MVSHIERQGFLSSAQDALNVGDVSFQDMSSSEILEMEQKAVSSENGARYDVRYRFEPDYHSMVDDLELSQVLAILPALVRINAAYEAVSSLPPIPGQLVGAGVVLKWDPEIGILESQDDTCPIRWHVKEGTLQIKLAPGSRWVNVTRETDGSAFYEASANHVSQNATHIVSLARKEISL
jgi:hypothetical protein